MDDPASVASARRRETQEREAKVHRQNIAAIMESARQNVANVKRHLAEQNLVTPAVAAFLAEADAALEEEDLTAVRQALQKIVAKLKREELNDGRYRQGDLDDVFPAFVPRK